MKKIILTPESKEVIDLTSEEIAEHNALSEETKQHFETLKQKEQDAETKKTSGKQKLLDLGLTEEEVKALIGV